jgi:hypothetical protein
MKSPATPPIAAVIKLNLMLAQYASMYGWWKSVRMFSSV